MNLVPDQKSLNLCAPLLRDKAADSLKDLAQYSQAELGQDSDYWETDSEASDGYSSDSSSEYEFNDSYKKHDSSLNVKYQQGRPNHQQHSFNWYGVQPSNQRILKEEKSFLNHPTLNWNGHNWFVPTQLNFSLKDSTYNQGQKFQQIFNSLLLQHHTSPLQSKEKKTKNQPPEGNKYKQNTSKNNTQKSLQQNPNQWEFRTRTSHQMEQKGVTQKKPSFFNSKIHSQLVQNQQDSQGTIQQQIPPTKQTNQLIEESIPLQDKICGDSPKNANVIPQQQNMEKDKIQRESPKNIPNRENNTKQATTNRPDSGQFLINEEHKEKRKQMKGQYIINQDVYIQPKEVQTKLLLNEFQNFDPNEIRFKLLQRLLTAHDKNKFHNFEPWEIQLIDQLSPLYQGEIELRSIQERVLLTNTLFKSNFEEYLFGEQSQKPKQPQINVRKRQRKEQKKKKEWHRRLTEKTKKVL